MVSPGPSRFNMSEYLIGPPFPANLSDLVFSELNSVLPPDASPLTTAHFVENEVLKIIETFLVRFIKSVAPSLVDISSKNSFWYNEHLYTVSHITDTDEPNTLLFIVATDTVKKRELSTYVDLDSRGKYKKARISTEPAGAIYHEKFLEIISTIYRAAQSWLEVFIREAEQKYEDDFIRFIWQQLRLYLGEDAAKISVWPVDRRSGIYVYDSASFDSISRSLKETTEGTSTSSLILLSALLETGIEVDLTLLAQGALNSNTITEGRIGKAPYRSIATDYLIGEQHFYETAEIASAPLFSNPSINTRIILTFPKRLTHKVQQLLDNPILSRSIEDFLRNNEVTSPTDRIKRGGNLIARVSNRNSDIWEAPSLTMEVILTAKKDKIKNEIHNIWRLIDLDHMDKLVSSRRNALSLLDHCQSEPILDEVDDYLSDSYNGTIQPRIWLLAIERILKGG